MTWLSFFNSFTLEWSLSDHLDYFSVQNGVAELAVMLQLLGASV